MNEQSRIRFNPFTKEIEIEGSEAFVKTYFDKLQAMMSAFTQKGEKGSKKEHPSPLASTSKTESKKATPLKKKTGKAESPGSKTTQMSTIVGLIQESTEGASTAMLKEKTGLTELQIWNIVNRAAKAGKIRKIKRGLYGAV